MDISFESQIRRWQSEKATWWFFSLPLNAADQIRFAMGSRPPKGFGSVRVEVSLGDSIWRTSLFPNKSDNNYLLPVKAKIRLAESINSDQTYCITVRLLEI